MRASRCLLLFLVLAALIPGVRPAAAAEPAVESAAGDVGDLAAAQATLDELLGPQAGLEEKVICRRVCDYTFPSVTPTAPGYGTTCQQALGLLSTFVSLYASQTCNPDDPCGVATVVTTSCFYNVSLGVYEVRGYGVFSCFDTLC